MDKHTLKVLAFDRVMEMLKEQAASSLGKEAAALTVPTTILEVAKIKQKETKEARDILELEANIPFGGIEDIRPMVEFASVGSMLQPNDLLTILNTLKSSDRLKFYLVKMTEKYPLMGSLASEIVIFKDLETKISSAISLNAEVLDSASQSLANARNELRTTQNRLMERMQSFISSSKYHTYIQEPVITLRSDRYCIPVKAEYKNNIPGIVHDASSSGATLFIEPAVVVELANKRRQLALKEKEEIEKVLTRLSILVGDVCEQIVASMNVVAMLDNITARARLAMNMDAIQPIINDIGKVQLYAARHPLIPGRVVPIDISLGKTFNALLITGPNTGGKTVSLKTLGLLSLMAASGLQIPAEPGSEISIFDQIFADVGDEQSIEQSLSTFSSHLKNIIHITERASDKSLVLLDELGAGTDPAEGAALAKSVLDYLLSKGAKIVATTHYGELKEFAYVRDGIQNASVEFDHQTLRPTYRLLIGVPGSSNAFAIATRLGLNEAIINDAKSNLVKRSEDSEELIRCIEESHHSAAMEERAAKIMSSEAEEIKRKYEAKLEKIETIEARAESKVREHAQKIIDRYSKKLDFALEELARQQKDSRRSQSLKKKIVSSIDEMDRVLVEKPEDRSEEEIIVTGSELSPGKQVRITGINQDGEIIEILDDGKALVMMGQMKVTVPISSLRLSSSKPAPRQIAKETGAKIAFTKAQGFISEINLRGMRVEPALIVLDKYVDDAITAGVRQIRIVHGKGTGVMRTVVSEYLRTHPCIESYRIGEEGEGGSGVTVALLK